jgi:RimJ/RimL family protein N-acetyltransferase
VIETPRLLLRRHTAADLPASAALWSDPQVTRYITTRPFTREETWARVLRYIGHWEALGYGFWAVEDKATGAFAGELGFADFKREIDPPITEPEAGWAFLPRFHGRGYATEAVQAALSWGDAHLAAPQTVCLIHPENAPSFRVAERCGFRESRRAMYKEQPTVVLTRNRERERAVGAPAG